MTHDDIEMWHINIVNDADQVCSIYGEAAVDGMFQRYGATCKDGLSNEAIADIVGIKHTTFLSRLKKAKWKLPQEFPRLVLIMRLRLLIVVPVAFYKLFLFHSSKRPTRLQWEV